MASEAALARAARLKRLRAIEEAERLERARARFSIAPPREEVYSTGPSARAMLEDANRRSGTVTDFDDYGGSSSFVSRSRRGDEFAEVTGDQRTIPDPLTFDERPSLQVSWAGASTPNSGLGMPAHLQGLSRARAADMDYVSDGSLSADAVGFWRALERGSSDGNRPPVRVEWNPEATPTRKGGLRAHGSWVARVRREDVKPAIAALTTGAAGLTASLLAPPEPASAAIRTEAGRPLSRDDLADLPPPPRFPRDVSVSPRDPSWNERIAEEMRRAAPRHGWPGLTRFAADVVDRPHDVAAEAIAGGSARSVGDDIRRGAIGVDPNVLWSPEGQLAQQLAPLLMEDREPIPEFRDPYFEDPRNFYQQRFFEAPGGGVERSTADQAVDRVFSALELGSAPFLARDAIRLGRAGVRAAGKGAGAVGRIFGPDPELGTLTRPEAAAEFQAAREGLADRSVARFGRADAARYAPERAAAEARLVAGPAEAPELVSRPPASTADAPLWFENPRFEAIKPGWHTIEPPAVRTPPAVAAEIERATRVRDAARRLGMPTAELSHAIRSGDATAMRAAIDDIDPKGLLDQPVLPRVSAERPGEVRRLMAPEREGDLAKAGYAFTRAPEGQTYTAIGRRNVETGAAAAESSVTAARLTRVRNALRALGIDDAEVDDALLSGIVRNARSGDEAIALALERYGQVTPRATIEGAAAYTPDELARRAPPPLVDERLPPGDPGTPPLWRDPRVTVPTVGAGGLAALAYAASRQPPPPEPPMTTTAMDETGAPVAALVEPPDSDPPPQMGAARRGFGLPVDLPDLPPGVDWPFTVDSVPGAFSQGEGRGPQVAPDPRFFDPVDLNPRNRGHVRALQRLLADKGFDPGEIDGVVGKDTNAALDAIGREYGWERRPTLEDAWTLALAYPDRHATLGDLQRFIVRGAERAGQDNPLRWSGSRSGIDSQYGSRTRAGLAALGAPESALPPVEGYPTQEQLDDWLWGLVMGNPRWRELLRSSAPPRE